MLAELRALTRDREPLIWDQRDVENQLRAVVLIYHPSVLHLFSSLDRDITLAFLRDYSTPDQAGRVGAAGWPRSAAVMDTPGGPDGNCSSSGCGPTCYPPQPGPPP